MVYMRAIASAPHPLGSDANNTVRNYLLAQLSSLGLNPQVFDGTGIAHSRNTAVIAHTRDIRNEFRPVIEERNRSKQGRKARLKGGNMTMETTEVQLSLLPTTS